MCVPARHDLIEVIRFDMLARPLGPDVSPSSVTHRRASQCLARARAPEAHIDRWLGCVMSTSTERNSSRLSRGLDRLRTLARIDRTTRMGRSRHALAAPAPGMGTPMAVFFFGRVERAKGGLTKAVLMRASLFAAAGWSTHLALAEDAPELSEVLAELRAAGRLHPEVVVHRFPVERSRLPGEFEDRIRTGQREGDRAEQLAAWLDWMISRDGAVVFVDSPMAVPVLARMRDPRAGRIYVVHVPHLAQRAYRGVTAEQVAVGPLTRRFRDRVDPHLAELDRIVTLTAAQRDDLVTRYGPSLPVVVIPHFAEPQPLQALPPEYDPRLVLAMGRLLPVKRFDDALQVMARVLAEVPDARMVVHGRGEDLPRLQHLAAELGIAERVEFPGYTTDPHAAMAQATCLLVTGRREAMPLTQLECLTVGTPVVVYDVRYGPAEIVRDGIDGFVVPEGDLQAAADSIVRLLLDPALRARMSASAMEVTERFSRQEYDEAWLDLARRVHDERVR
jgi:glycosyltransferase involved in cell wall biosynthesis